jgi:hypothetical protein
MKKKLLCLALIGIFSFTLVGCNSEPKNDSVDIGEKSKYVLRNDLVSISVNEESLTDSKATFTLINHTDENYDYGEPYLIEYEKDNIWYVMPPINNMDFNLPAYILEPNKSRKITADWEYHYGKLSPGKYRLIKDVFRESDIPIEESDKVYIGAEFIIE